MSLVIGGVPVVESYLACTSTYVKVHKKRRNQTVRYHRRVQKKWGKRFGFKTEPGAYMTDASVLGSGVGKLMVVHPTIMAKLRGMKLN